jgi:hypothetical protein
MSVLPWYVVSFVAVVCRAMGFGLNRPTLRVAPQKLRYVGVTVVRRQLCRRGVSRCGVRFEPPHVTRRAARNRTRRQGAHDQMQLATPRNCVANATHHRARTAQRLQSARRSPGLAVPTCLQTDDMLTDRRHAYRPTTCFQMRLLQPSAGRMVSDSQTGWNRKPGPLSSVCRCVSMPFIPTAEKNLLLKRCVRELECRVCLWQKRIFFRRNV